MAKIAAKSSAKDKIVDKSSEQEWAEADVEAFKQDLGPFVVAVETTRMAMVFTDAAEPDNPVIFVNDAFLKLTGFDRDEVLGQSFDHLMVQGTDEDVLEKIAAQLEGDAEGGCEVCYRRKDGSTFWSALFISPVRDEAGVVVQHFASFVDTTAHKKELAHSKMLIDELNHRVKNTLATVQSIVSQALRTETEPAVIRDSIESRLFALSRSHDLLSRENWKSAGLHDIINDALEPFGVADGRAERFEVKGEDVRFPPNAALALGIAFHELATNAVKYGAYSNGAGCVRIGWTVDHAPGGERLRLTWREEGGPPVKPPSHKGFGSRVLERGLAHELKGTVQINYEMDGVVCLMEIAAPKSFRDG